MVLVIVLLLFAMQNIQ